MQIRTIRLTESQIEELEIFRDNKEKSAAELKKIQAVLLINKEPVRKSGHIKKSNSRSK